MGFWWNYKHSSVDLLLYTEDLSKQSRHCRADGALADEGRM